eukprot:Tamp_04366.p2 GENE.Tamp_04366~~Tamp_04366.p2  ORF type:complete len:160 (-),score=15.40 Tamp_04366:1054-1533(-)
MEISNEIPDVLVPRYLGDNCEVDVYNEKKRDANETKTETKELIFQAPAIWPALVPPLVVLGVAVVLLVVRLVFNIIDKRIATARAHQEALRIASEGVNADGKSKRGSLRRAGSTRAVRDPMSRTMSAQSNLVSRTGSRRGRGIPRANVRMRLQAVHVFQ